MKISSFLFACLLIFSFSCKDKDDAIPQISLDGTFEHAIENQETGLWFVSQYVFHADGKMQLYHLLRESKNGPTLGYTFYQRSTYTLRGTSFSQTIQRAYGVDLDSFPEGFAENLQDLKEINPSGLKGPKGTLKRLENGNKISILFECNDTLGELASCLGELIYDKVE